MVSYQACENKSNIIDIWSIFIPHDRCILIFLVFQFVLLRIWKRYTNSASFSSEKISDFGTVAFSFLFNKYYPIID